MEMPEEQEERLLDVRHWDLLNFSKWSHWPLKGHGSHLRAYDRVDWQHLVANHINIVGLLSLHQYGLTLARPQAEQKRQYKVSCDAIDPSRNSIVVLFARKTVVGRHSCMFIFRA